MVAGPAADFLPASARLSLSSFERLRAVRSLSICVTRKFVNMKMKIVLACGGPSSEHEVSLMSAEAILQALDRKKYSISIFYITKDLQVTSFLSSKKINISIQKHKFIPLIDGIKKYLKQSDSVLLAGMHGEFVEDGRFQSLLDFFNIKYTGSGMAASALCMDKYRSSQIIKNVPKLKMLKTLLVNTSDKINFHKIKYPLVIKPNNLGSSVGVKIIHNKKEIIEHVQYLTNKLKIKEILFQEYLKDTIELSCGCLEDRVGKLMKLPPIEIIPQTSKFFDYNAKYKTNASIEISPPKNIDKKLADKISEITCQIHKLLGCKVYSRSDFLIQGNKIYYLETNTLPGMTKNSLLPKEAKAAGIAFPKLLDFIIDNN